jgi:hypothetical protein
MSPLVPTWADLFVGGIACVASCKAHLGWVHSFQDPELALSSPEAAHSCREQNTDKSCIQIKLVTVCHRVSPQLLAEWRSCSCYLMIKKAQDSVLYSKVLMLKNDLVPARRLSR